MYSELPEEKSNIKLNQIVILSNLLDPKEDTPLPKDLEDYITKNIEDVGRLCEVGDFPVFICFLKGRSLEEALNALSLAGRASIVKLVGLFSEEDHRVLLELSKTLYRERHITIAIPHYTPGIDPNMPNYVTTH